MCIVNKNVPSANYAFYKPENIALCVPYESRNAYQSTDPWNMFNITYSYNSSDTQEGQKCSKPTFSIVDGKLAFSCETQDVQYHWSVSTPDGTSGTYPVRLSITLNVFATKDGYQPSDVATYKFPGLVGDVDGNGVVNVADHVELTNIILNQE